VRVCYYGALWTRNVKGRDGGGGGGRSRDWRGTAIAWRGSCMGQWQKVPGGNYGRRAGTLGAIACTPTIMVLFRTRYLLRRPVCVYIARAPPDSCTVHAPILKPRDNISPPRVTKWMLTTAIIGTATSAIVSPIPSLAQFVAFFRCRDTAYSYGDQRRFPVTKARVNCRIGRNNNNNDRRGKFKPILKLYGTDINVIITNKKIESYSTRVWTYILFGVRRMLRLCGWYWQQIRKKLNEDFRVSHTFVCMCDCVHTLRFIPDIFVKLSDGAWI